MNNRPKSKNLLIFLLIISLVFPNLNFIKSESALPPETPEEVKELGEKALETTKKEGPGILERIWKEEVLPVWQAMWDWAKNYWRETMWPWIKEFWERRVKSPVAEEAEKRKEIIEEKVEKEKKEIEEKIIPETAKSIWERLKDFWE